MYQLFLVLQQELFWSLAAQRGENCQISQKASPLDEPISKMQMCRDNHSPIIPPRWRGSHVGLCGLQQGYSDTNGSGWWQVWLREIQKLLAPQFNSQFNNSQGNNNNKNKSCKQKNSLEFGFGVNYLFNHKLLFLFVWGIKMIIHSRLNQKISFTMNWISGDQRSG